MICNLQIDCCGALVRSCAGFSGAGSADLTTRSGDRRPKSAGTNATHQVVPSYLCLSR